MSEIIDATHIETRVQLLQSMIRTNLAEQTEMVRELMRTVADYPDDQVFLSVSQQVGKIASGLAGISLEFHDDTSAEPSGDSPVRQPMLEVVEAIADEVTELPETAAAEPTTQDATESAIDEVTIIDETASEDDLKSDEVSVQDLYDRLGITRPAPELPEPTDAAPAPAPQSSRPLPPPIPTAVAVESGNQDSALPTYLRVEKIIAPEDAKHVFEIIDDSTYAVDGIQYPFNYGKARSASKKGGVAIPVMNCLLEKLVVEGLSELRPSEVNDILGLGGGSSKSGAALKSLSEKAVKNHGTFLFITNGQLARNSRIIINPDFAFIDRRVHPVDGSEPVPVAPEVVAERPVETEVTPAEEPILQPTVDSDPSEPEQQQEADNGSVTEWGLRKEVSDQGVYWFVGEQYLDLSENAQAVLSYLIENPSTSEFRDICDELTVTVPSLPTQKEVLAALNELESRIKHLTGVNYIYDKVLGKEKKRLIKLKTITEKPTPDEGSGTPDFLAQ